MGVHAWIWTIVRSSCAGFGHEAMPRLDQAKRIGKSKPASRPNSAPKRQNIVQIQALSAHFRANFVSIKLRASHGRSPELTSCRCPCELPPKAKSWPLFDTPLERTPSCRSDPQAERGASATGPPQSDPWRRAMQAAPMLARICANTGIPGTDYAENGCGLYNAARRS